MFCSEAFLFRKALTFVASVLHCHTRQPRPAEFLLILTRLFFLSTSKTPCSTSPHRIGATFSGPAGEHLIAAFHWIRRGSRRQSCATVVDEPLRETQTRPSAEEWYPRIHLGWNFKDFVEVYCYFASSVTEPDFKIKWPTHAVGPPPMRGPNTFDHVLWPAGIWGESTMVKTAIIKGLAEQYYSQERFKEDTPVCPWVEPTPEEILATWEEHTLDMEREQNMQMVKDMILASFGICISVDQVKLLTRFSKLRLIFVFDTYSWKPIHCFKSKPQHLPFAPTPTPEAGKEGSLKRKGTEDEVKMDQPASKCPTLSREGPRSKRREGRARSSSIPLNDTALSAISPAEASTATSSTARNERATTSPPAISSARSPTQTNATPNITMLPLAGKEPQFLIQPAYSKALSEGLTRTILISSWLRLLPSISVQSPETCRTIEIWLKDTFSIEVKWSDIIKMTDEARKDNLSPLNTGAFRGLVTANSAELGTMLMNPCRPTRDEKARRGSLVLMSGHVNEAMCQAGKSSGVGLRC